MRGFLLCITTMLRLARVRQGQRLRAERPDSRFLAGLAPRTTAAPRAAISTGMGTRKKRRQARQSPVSPSPCAWSLLSG
jgi:hypothetical protein